MASSDDEVETFPDSLSDSDYCSMDDENEKIDTVCAICDNGGQLICCEGRCFRSFHATGDSEEAQDSKCESSGLIPQQLEEEGTYLCENCLYNLHQCFVCGELGSSDTEVFRCSFATCRHFYHPQCVANLIHENDITEQQSLKEKIGAGDPFVCPAHMCAVCKQMENQYLQDSQFAICRRCPTSYHRKCLPGDIILDDRGQVRVWDGLLNKSRALIYCMKHEIDVELATPARTLKFRNILQ